MKKTINYSFLLLLTLIAIIEILNASVKVLGNTFQVDSSTLHLAANLTCTVKVGALSDKDHPKLYSVM